MNQKTPDASNVTGRHNERFSTQHLSFQQATSSTSDDLLTAFGRSAPLLQSRNVPSLQSESNCGRDTVDSSRLPSDSRINDNRCEAASSNWLSDNQVPFSLKPASASSNINDELSALCLKHAPKGAEWYSDDQFPAAGGFSVSDYVAGYQGESFGGGPRAPAPPPAINVLHHQRLCEDAVARRADDCFYETCHDGDMPLSLCTRTRDKTSSSNDVEQKDVNKVICDNNDNNNNNNCNYYVRSSRCNVIQQSGATANGKPANHCRVSYGSWSCDNAGHDGSFAARNPSTHVDASTGMRVGQREFAEASSSTSHTKQLRPANDYDIPGRTFDESQLGTYVDTQVNASWTPKNDRDQNDIARIKMSQIPVYVRSRANAMNASKVDEATVSSTDSRFESRSPSADGYSFAENGSVSEYALPHDGCTSTGGLSCMPLKCRFKNSVKDYPSSGRHYV